MERILGAARDIVNTYGAASLTMRGLATHLKTSPTVLYRAVADRAELLDRVVDMTLGDIVIEPSGRDWVADCRDIAQAMFDALDANRGVAPLLIERVPTGLNALRLREAVLAVLLDHGFTVEDAALAYATVARYTIGFAAQLRSAEHGADNEARRLSALFNALDADALPATRAVADVLPFQSLHTEFRFGLDLLVDGLSARRATS